MNALEVSKTWKHRAEIVEILFYAKVLEEDGRLSEETRLHTEVLRKILDAGDRLTAARVAFSDGASLDEMTKLLAAHVYA